MDPLEVLTYQYQNNKLASFYIVRAATGTSREHCAQTLKDFSIKCSQSICSEHNLNYCDELGHADIVHIHKDAKAKTYKKDDPSIIEFFKSIKYQPIQLKNKFIWVHDSDCISELFLNKWLKVLEEPAAGISVIFLHPIQSELLDTIESRAIKLRLNQEHGHPNISTQTQYENFSDFLSKNLAQYSEDFHLDEKAQKLLAQFAVQTQQIHLIGELLKSDAKVEPLLYEACLDYCRGPSAKLWQLELTLERVQWFKKAQIFHNSASERIISLLSVISSDMLRPT